MSYDAITLGFEAFDGFVKGLEIAGTGVIVVEDSVRLAPDGRSLRKAHFKAANGRKMIAEEYVAFLSYDCDGVSTVELAIYRESNRPNLESRMKAAR